MFAGKQFDIVMGTDIHLIQPPGPVPPVPIPHPFIGIVFDPPEFIPSIGTILVNGLPRAQAGSNVKNTPPHIPIGGTFVKPPGNDGEVYMGGNSVKAETDPFTYFGAQVLTCQDAGMSSVSREERHSKSKPKSMLLPVSVLLPVPKGGPVMLESGTEGSETESSWGEIGEAALEIVKKDPLAVLRILKEGFKYGRAGAIAGGNVGTGAGAVVGSIVPGAGTVAGAGVGRVVGTGVGGLGGALYGAGKQAKQEIQRGLVVKSKKKKEDDKKKKKKDEEEEHPVKENYKQGKEHEGKVGEDLKGKLKEDETLLEQPSVKINGTDKTARPDFGLVDKEGNIIEMPEAKSGAGKLTPNQELLQEKGGTLIGKNAGEFAGKPVPPGSIRIIRPPDLIN